MEQNFASGYLVAPFSKDEFDFDSDILQEFAREAADTAHEPLGFHPEFGPPIVPSNATPRSNPIIPVLQEHSFAPPPPHSFTTPSFDNLHNNNSSSFFSNIATPAKTPNKCLHAVDPALQEQPFTPLSFNNLHDDDKFFSDIVTPAKAPKKRARSETTTASPAAAAKKAKGSANKENGSAAQAAVEADEILASGRPWSVADKTKLFTWLLGAEGDEFFEIHKKDPARIHKKAAKQLFSNKVTVNAVKGQITRAIKTYDMIVAFEKFTGGGGDGDLDGDGDEDVDDKERALIGLTTRLDGARAAGFAVGSLTVKVIDQWYKEGWYNLFNERYGRSPKIAREVARHSASAVSSDEVETSGASSDIEPMSTPSSSKKAKSPASHTVAEPKHKAAAKHRADTSSSLSSLGDFLKLKVAMDDKRFLLMQEKAARDREREERLEVEARLKREQDEKRGHLEMAKAVLSMEGASDEAKAAANKYLLNLFNF